MTRLLGNRSRRIRVRSCPEEECRVGPSQKTLSHKLSKERKERKRDRVAAQQRKHLSDNLSAIPGTKRVEGENRPLQAVSDLQRLAGTHKPPHRHKEGSEGGKERRKGRKKHKVLGSIPSTAYTRWKEKEEREGGMDGCTDGWTDGWRKLP